MSKAITKKDDNFLAVPDGAAEAYGDDAEENAALIDDAFHTISIQGAKYSVDGKKIGDKGVEFEAVILQAMPLNIYYAKPFDTDDPGPPDCSSLGGITPDKGVDAPPSEECTSCAMNKFGSAPARTDGTKRKGKACSNKRRLVLHIDGVDLPAILDIPPTSVASFTSLIKLISSNVPKVPLPGVVTKFTFADGTYPQPEVNVAGFLQPDEYAVMKELRASTPVQQALHAFSEPKEEL